MPHQSLDLKQLSMRIMQIESTHIAKPQDHDILNGRGNSINYHPGNQFFRSLVKAVRIQYVAALKPDKPMIAKLLVQQIRNLDPPGRFLTQVEDGRYVDVGDKMAIAKTRQALREGAPEIELLIKNGRILVDEKVSLVYE